MDVLDIGIRRHAVDARRLGLDLGKRLFMRRDLVGGGIPGRRELDDVVGQRREFGRHVVARRELEHRRLRLRSRCLLGVLIAQRGHLLGERAGELELADHPLRHEHLAEPLARLALARERLVELLLVHEPAVDKDLSQTAPAGGVLRPGRASELRPLLRDHARKLLARDPEALDQHLSELLAALALDLERDADLALRDEPSLDEERADQTRGKRLRCRHARCIGTPSNGL